tara:strand:+ start:33 stop:1016 length:984 start_codon:yes stop_codon:yes gene_type:complete
MRLIVTRIKNISLGGLLFMILNGCEAENSLESQILSIPMTINIDRFDLKFHRTSSDAIPALKQAYPYLFPKVFADSVWVNRQKDTLQLMLVDTVDEVFPSMVPLEEELEYLFKHIKHYFPKTKIPNVIGLVNNVDYQSKTIYTDSLLLISLDTYFGADHYLYQGISNYVKQEMDAQYLTAHVIDKFSDYKVNPPEDRTLLSQMIFYGKKLYLKDLLIPNKTNAIKIGYTIDQEEWVRSNELYMWQFFIEKQLIYSSDPALIQRFIDPAPFSKFYLEIDNESPGGIGKWLGWQIVKSYVENNPKVEINKLLSLPAQTIFNKSNYKPRR